MTFFYKYEVLISLSISSSPCSIVANVLDCNIVVNEFEYLLCYQTKTLGKCMVYTFPKGISLFSPIMVKLLLFY